MNPGLPLKSIPLLASTQVLVLGDLILDHYMRGTTERTSPEAPVPVVLLQSEESIPGGAANVARNVRAAGAQALCAGVVGEDAQGQTLRAHLEELGADCAGVFAVAGRPTTVKTRIISQSQQMLRFDREVNTPIPEPVQAALVESCCERMTSCQAVIVSDYAKGVLTPFVLESVLACARRLGIPLFVDPKGRRYAHYRGAYGLTPNAREAFEATGIATSDPAGLSEAASAIAEATDSELVVITRGGEGIALFERGQQPLLIPAAAREVFDVSGAGDTFIAFLAMGIGAGLPASEAARLANAAAGVVVAKSGAATVSPFELRAALSSDAAAKKLRAPQDMAALGEELRRAGKRIVFTNGCFDFIHAGHVAFLQNARSLGDVLVLATNTDEMITRLKGAPRPIIRQDQREKLLAAIEAVDIIVPFGEETPNQLIRDLKPDILVKGSNYSVEQVEGHSIVEASGGRVVLIEVMEAISTRELIAGRKRS